jgi:hypothetical protein
MPNEVYVHFNVTSPDLRPFQPPETAIEIRRFRQTLFTDFPGWDVDYEEKSDGSLDLKFTAAWEFPSDWMEALVAAFPKWDFVGSAACDQDEWYIELKGSAGVLTETELDYKEQFGEEEDEEGSDEEAADAA